MPSFFGPMDTPPFVPDGPFRHAGPPRNIPGLSGQRVILHQSKTLGVGMYRFESFSNGFSFTVEIEGRGHGLGRFHFLFGASGSWPDQEDDPDQYDQPDQQFRLGLEFSDGTRWKNFVQDQDQGLSVRTLGETAGDLDAVNGSGCRAFRRRVS